MTITNYHTHFELDDGNGQLEEYAESAIEKGMSILGFSPHAPLPYPNDWSLTEEGLQSYLSLIEKIKAEYKGRLTVYKGLEIDYLSRWGGPADSRWKELNLDYCIGSVHSMEIPETGEELSVDGPVEDLIRILEKRFDGNAEQLVHTYFELEMEMIEAGGFDILGHCDLIKKRNTDNRFFKQDEGWYRDKALEMLKLASEKDIVIEVNTGGLSRGTTTEVYPSPWMLGKCRELNIPLTLTSDAHRSEHLDFYMKEAAGTVKSAGYGEIYFFSEGKWLAQPI